MRITDSFAFLWLSALGANFKSDFAYRLNDVVRILDSRNTRSSMIFWSRHQMLVESTPSKARNTVREAKNETDHILTEPKSSFLILLSASNRSGAELQPVTTVPSQRRRAHQCPNSPATPGSRTSPNPFHHLSCHLSCHLSHHSSHVTQQPPTGDPQTPPRAPQQWLEPQNFRSQNFNSRF